MTGAKKLVIGASGFLGSDVTRQLWDCGDVFYCVVDTRAWLRDPAPLFRTNVEGLRHVLHDAQLAAQRQGVRHTSSWLASSASASGGPHEPAG